MPNPIHVEVWPQAGHEAESWRLIADAPDALACCRALLEGDPDKIIRVHIPGSRQHDAGELFRQSDLTMTTV
jgi:hypothetical protein